MKIVTVTILLAACLVASNLSQAQEDTSETPVGCYQSGIVYLTGTMNIREQASTSSRVVRQSSPGESFDILSSQQGSTYCWLESEDGWIAETRLVQSSVARSHQGLPNCTKSDVEAYTRSMEWFGQDYEDSVWSDYNASKTPRDWRAAMTRFIEERDEYVIGFPICYELSEIRDLFILVIDDNNLAFFLLVAGTKDSDNMFLKNSEVNSARLLQLVSELAGTRLK